MWTEWRLLSLARCYIEKGWTQDTLARDLYGNDVEPNQPEAAAWCILGALDRAQMDLNCYGTREGAQVRSAALATMHEIVGGWGEADTWNDAEDREREEVLELFDLAMAQAMPRTTGRRLATLVL